jgi:hypothetical protein
MSTVTADQLIGQHYSLILQACQCHHQRDELKVWTEQFISCVTANHSAQVRNRFQVLLVELMATEIVQLMCTGTYSSSGLVTTLEPGCHLEDYVPIFFKKSGWARAKGHLLAAEMRLERSRLKNGYIPSQEHTHFLEPAGGVVAGTPVALRRLRAPKAEIAAYGVQERATRKDIEAIKALVAPKIYKPPPTVVVRRPTLPPPSLLGNERVGLKGPPTLDPISREISHSVYAETLSPPISETSRSVPTISESE